MRGLVLTAAVCVAASPALAKAPSVIDPDPMTVSGRFELPRAAEPVAGQFRLGAVMLDPELAAKTKQDAVALQAAVQGAVSRSLQNFGYLAPAVLTEATAVDVELLPVAVERTEDGAAVTARLKFTAQGVAAGCFARVSEGRFTVLERERSEGGRRAFAIGAVVALAFVGVNGGTLLASEFDGAADDNRARNTLRKVAAGEGVAPGFGEARLLAYGASSATRLALADYIRQLGEAPACGAGGESPEVDAGVTLAR